MEKYKITSREDDKTLKAHIKHLSQLTAPTPHTHACGKKKEGKTEWQRRKAKRLSEKRELITLGVLFLDVMLKLT